MAGIHQLNNKAGFTFLETLMSLTVITISIPFLLYLIANTTYTSQIDMLSTEQFFIFIRNEIMESKAVEISGNTLKFKGNDNRTVTINQYNTLIRRQVAGMGHEIFIRDVQDFRLTELDYGVLVAVTTLEGETYERTFRFH